MAENNERNDLPKPKKKKGKKLTIIMVVIFVVAAAGGFFTFRGGLLEKGSLFGLSEKPVTTEKVEKNEKVATINFDNIQVNLADQNVVRYLSASVVLEYPDKKKIAKEVTTKGYRLKDGIIKVLRSKKVTDLDTEKKVSLLKKQILAEINSDLTSGKISSVYFEQFIIQ